MVQPMASAGLLERGRELALLQGAWRHAAAGHGSAWLVCAEAGGGKTRLLREASRGLPVRRGAAEPVVPPDPYLAVMQALRGFRPAPQRAESVARAVARLDQLAADGPIAVVLDDLHFADEGTVAVFVRLATEAATRPWLVLGAFRPGEGSDALRLAATELVGQGHAGRLDLAPLTRAGVATLVAAVRGAAVGAAEVDAIYADSGGNPWFAEALARGAGAMSAARDRILLRLDRLERAIPGAAPLLAALAPAGEPLPHVAVAALGGGDGPELRRILRGLRDAAVLRESNGAWQFRHELLRRSLLETMLEADRRDAHRRLAAALEGQGSAAALAMHYAVAEDARAGAWALRAAQAARAVDAHAEAQAQLERALSVPLDPETQRVVLGEAAQGAWYLGRFGDGLRFAEAGLAIPGGAPELVSQLHQRAADCARVLGQSRAAVGHMDAAERVLDGQPVSVQLVRLATARAWEAAALMHPERAVTAADRAIRLARRLADRDAGARYELAARCYLGLAQLDAGDPAGFAAFDARIGFGTTDPEVIREAVPQALNAYAYAVRSLFHAEAERFRRWLVAGIERHHLDWDGRVGAYHALELVQRGAFAEVRSRFAALAPPPSGTIEGTIGLLARVLLETRAGSAERARALLAAAHPPGAFAHAALVELARIEVASFIDVGETPPPADIYARAEGRRFARLAGMAAVAAARTGGTAPARPAWLAAAAPLGVFWDWAGGITTGNAPALRAVADRLTQLGCPYEAALALRDAGDLPEAYRSLRALGATTARERVARLLRAAGAAIPRGPGGAGASAALTDTERTVCRLVGGGATNAAIAAVLGVGVRTVETYLGRIYQKTGQPGRTALAAWWGAREREGEPGP